MIKNAINEPILFLDTKRDKAVAILNWGETRLRQLYGKRIDVRDESEVRKWQSMGVARGSHGEIVSMKMSFKYDWEEDNEPES